MLHKATALTSAALSSRAVPASTAAVLPALGRSPSAPISTPRDVVVVSDGSPTCAATTASTAAAYSTALPRSRLNRSALFQAVPSLAPTLHPATSAPVSADVAAAAAGFASSVFGGPAGRGTSYTPAHRANLPVNLGILLVPQQEAWVVERLGRYHKILEPGLALLIPFLDRVAYRHTLKEVALEIPDQTAITQDNVSLLMDGVLYYRIKDAEKACYGVEDPQFAIMQMAVTTMRSEIGKISLDKTFEEREALNSNIVHAINQAAHGWGIECMRYEIRDITPPSSVLNAMELQVAAERKKRAQILDSQGEQQSEINIAEGAKQATVLASEAEMIERINHAKGEAEATMRLAEAKAKGLRVVAEATKAHGGSNAVAMRVAEEYIAAFGELAKKNNTMLLPSSASDPAAMVAQAMAIYKNVGGSSEGEDSPSPTLDAGAGAGEQHSLLSDSEADRLVREAYTAPPEERSQ